MNRLLEAVNTTLESGGVTYQINESYKSALLAWKAYASYELGDLSQGGYAQVLIDVLYLDPKPDIWNREALQFAGDYLNSFHENADGKGSKVPNIDIDQDASMIYSSLLAMGINIRKQDLTYEEFLALLKNLDPDCEYSRIMQLRYEYYERVWEKIKGKGTEKQRNAEKQRITEAIARIGESKVLVKDSEKEKASRRLIELKNKSRAERGLPLLDKDGNEIQADKAGDIVV